MKPYLEINDDLKLHQPDLDFAEELFALVDTNRLYLQKWLPWVSATKTVEDSRSFLKNVIRFSKGGQQLHSLIIYKNQLVGLVGFNTIRKVHQKAEVGYWLAENFTGKGIMTDAVTQVLRVGFDELGLHRIEIRCAVENIKSRAIPERLGFINEAILRQCEWLYSRYVDHFVYSILEYEFNAEGAGNVTPGTGTSHHRL